MYVLADRVDTQYAKLLTATTKQVEKLLADEKEILEIQLNEEGCDSLEGSYVQAALTTLKVNRFPVSNV